MGQGDSKTQSLKESTNKAKFEGSLDDLPAIEKLAWELWEQTDKDGNGELDEVQAYTFFTLVFDRLLENPQFSFRPSHARDETAKQWYNHFDANGDGTISWSEFLNGIREVARGVNMANNMKKTGQVRIRQITTSTNLKKIYSTRDNWYQLSDRFIFRHVFYTNIWPTIDFNKAIVIPSTFGGPVAISIRREENKLVQIDELADTSTSSIAIFSSSGTQLGTIMTDEVDKLVGVGWNDHEQLVLVLQTGAVMIYDMFGQLFQKYQLEGSCKKPGIRDVQFWGTGFVCLTKDLKLYAFMDYETPITMKLKDPGLEKAPTCWIAIEPQVSTDHSLEVLLATTTGSIIVVSEKLANDVQLSNGPFLHMSLSPSGKVLACYTQSHDVWVVTIDFATELSKFSTKAPQAPKQLAWIGGDALACYYKGAIDHVLLVIGPDANYTYLTYDSPIVLLTECDGMRVLSARDNEFISRAPGSAQYIFSKDAQNAAAMLYNAAKSFYEDHNPKADGIIRKIKPDLVAASNICLDSASQELDQSIQKSLFSAAAFGKSFLDGQDSKMFQNIVKVARVLNIVRDPKIGLPLTYQQYQVLTADLLVDKLLRRDLHMLAAEVLLHWASRKVVSRQSDTDVALSIVTKLKECPGISFASVANAAFKADRVELGARLLDFEARATEQIPLLLIMNKHERALTKAIQSGDTDLIHLVLIVLQGIENMDFYSTIRRYEEARMLWESICKKVDANALNNLYQADRVLGMAKLGKLEVQKSYLAADLDQRHDGLKKAVGYFKKAEEDWVAQQTEDEIALLLLQRDLEVSLGGTFVGSSLSQTLYRCVLLGADKRAKKIRNEFKVPNKRWWWIKIRALGAMGKWDDLQHFAKQKSPIGYRPFAEICMQNGNKVDAAYFNNLCEDDESKAMFFVTLGQWDQAIKVAERMADPEETLLKMQAKCRDSVIAAQIDGLIENLDNRSGLAFAVSRFQMPKFKIPT